MTDGVSARLGEHQFSTYWPSPTSSSFPNRSNSLVDISGTFLSIRHPRNNALHEHRPSNVALDAAAIALVPTVLAAIHFFVPQPTQLDLAFQYDFSKPWTLLTASYVHASDAHLLGNVVGYLVATLLAYQLCIEADRRRWFHRTFVAFLFVLPVLVNVADYYILTSTYPGVKPVSQGFSGVAAGFAGFVFVALLVSMRTAYDRETVFFTAQLVLLLLLTELLVIYDGIPRPTVLGVISVGVVTALWMLAGGVSATIERSTSEWKSIGVDAVRVGLVLLVLSYFVFLLFPSDVIADGSFTNIFAHAAGFVLGGVVSGIGYASTTFRGWGGDLGSYIRP